MTGSAAAHDEKPSSESWTELRVHIDARATGMTIRKGLVSQSLTAAISRTVEFKFYAQARGNTRIARESPFLEGVDTKHLDKDGIVLPGTIVTVNLIAVSAISPIGAIFGNSDEQQVRDSSSYFSAEHNGYVVAAVTRENIRDRPRYSEPGLIDRVTISLTRHDALAVGDFVEIAECSIAVVDVMDDELMPTDENQQAVDAIVPRYNPSIVDRSVQRSMVRRQLPSVRDTVEARSVGPYSLISLMPLKSRGVRGQTVTATEISWLMENRFVSIAAELVSLKCDDTLNREKLRELDGGCLTFPLTTEFGASESLFIATEELRLLGLGVDCETRDNCIAWRIPPATKDWLLRVAPLAIKKPETINYRTYRPEKEGLFCEQAFGPETHARR